MILGNVGLELGEAGTASHSTYSTTVHLQGRVINRVVREAGRDLQEDKKCGSRCTGLSVECDALSKQETHPGSVLLFLTWCPPLYDSWCVFRPRLV